ncbi:MAG: PEP-CTERM sorting domain-containing protein [Spartobacteria bacterium]|nr:PEP-CTERM sorting domain-containing protein [Spartobacteria bacterium]
MIIGRLKLCFLISGLLCLAASADVVSYFRFEGNALDETGLMDGEPLNFDGDVDYEGWSGNVFASTVPQTGQPNTGSLRFAGGSEFVDLSNNNDLSLGMNFTIEFYMNPDQPIIGSSIFGFSPLYGLSLSLILDVGQLEWYTQFNGQPSGASANMVQIGQWQHVALVMQPTEYSIYINGLMQYSGGIPPAGQGNYFFPGTDNTGDRTIGGNYGTFRGYLDEFRISDTALTPDQFLCAIPEPSTPGLMLLGAAGLAWRKRKK